MFSHRKNSVPSPSIDDSYFGFSLSIPSTPSSLLPGGGDLDGGRGDLEPDLILAAELGQALLEKNEELAASLQERERELEVVQQQRHVFQRKLEMNELASGQREAELVADMAVLRVELERHQKDGQDRRRDESDQLTQLANHNQRLVEQLAEAVTLEHTLRTELRALREEVDESSFSRGISFSQQRNMQAENKMLHGRLSHMAEQMGAVQGAGERLRAEREEQRERLADLQARLREKETEIEQEQGVVFELRSVNRTLQQKALRLGDESVLENTHMQPLSLLSEIQQSQAKDTLLAHSTVLQAKEEEIQSLKEELLSQQQELLSLREEIKPFHSNRNKPSYSVLEGELAVIQQEKESLTQQLMNTIKHKVALSQELEAWQEDMRLVLNEQVMQRQGELQKEQKETSEKREKERSSGLQRSKSLKLGGDKSKGFFTALFREK
ncbi:BICD family-like cargo adapter 2 isoform X1 [Gadus morhua]|uniref:BICD family-like cargo adapter 2 n=1 Tax=Gadus morhua TaxID=8049 RepID=A0A8C4Z078_GADMO|nr:BICD family-like cargo adapter 2 isoform X1 [Gadus morhua]XP_030218204.1 BICD family-like cargo adapter 2 isoform X1 [Gadus morhua]XP_030218205.1 BICD family-like cargo adapter 2 isoform X1 [Gadus morhua]XP_030218206.1 BICD family-like cargo adapter 2 isoform X1 [Gadus morhua]